MNEQVLRELQEALTTGALNGVKEEALLQQVCDRLIAAGVPLWRGAAVLETLHPTVEGTFFEWRRSKGQAGGRDYARAAGAEREDMWLKSPFYPLYERRESSLRRRRGVDHRAGEFPMVDEVFEQGATDYIAYVVRYDDAARSSDTDGLAASWCSDRPEGLSSSKSQQLARISG